ncbi:TPA: hypothetical protein NG675_003979 [Vibrio parahaemolyticus]|uniref:hypothetical protein n=1 Tax=Vibrio harveyi group TaxID=717610 RepID=UPI00130244DF|nr:hypothetical protein [Vibrio parahaemolyticus]MDF4376502.1 hypothetical protein [Vibrio parahaemolyticus]HCE2818021.1 hypothetical protein [Vibrio parahaemolyticus]HCE2912699.1 hypothetical protein [Vibrio parahaemolyticus]HCE3620996.1 hypothetical protein [Vibrio parahaemolyticus]HCG5306682.1 hypothetical protein [Vibrio parahaemolyticus]
MNNAYHQFIRLPKEVVNATLFDLKRANYVDAIDVFEFLTNLTHHNSFQSRMIYQNELLGIQRRLNKVLLPHGYRLKSKQVPIGIQRAHKVSASERRWGFERVTPRQVVNRIVERSSYGQLIAEERKKQKELAYQQAAKRVLNMTVDEAILRDFGKEVDSFDLDSCHFIAG